MAVGLACLHAGAGADKSALWKVKAERSEPALTTALSFASRPTQSVAPRAMTVFDRSVFTAVRGGQSRSRCA